MWFTAGFMLASSQTRLPRTQSSDVFAQTPIGPWQQKQTYHIECSWNHEPDRRLFLLYKYISLSVLFTCLHLPYLNLNDSLRQSLIEAVYLIMGISWRSKEEVNHVMIQIFVWPCPRFPQIANTWRTGGETFWALLHPLVCADIDGEMNADSCTKVSSIGYRKATTHSFCRSVVYWVLIQAENLYPTQICCGFSSIRAGKLRDFMLQCTMKVSWQCVDV